MLTDRMNIIALTLVVVTVIALVTGIFLMNRDVGIEIEEERYVDYHFRLAESEVVGWSKGEKVWRILVETIMEPRDEGSRVTGENIVLQDISEGFFYRAGDVFFTFTVREAHYNTRTENLKLFNVRLETPAGDWMESEQVLYEKEKETLFSPGPVTGRMAGTDFTAGEMTVCLEKEEIFLSGGVNLKHTLEGRK